MPESITFNSKYREERLVRSPVNKVPTATGEQMNANPNAVSYSFAPNGTLTVLAGQDERPDGPPGEDGQPTVQDAAAWIRSRPGFNVHIFEEGREPGRPLPTEQELSKQITAATLQLDVDELQAIIQRERETHERASVLTQAQEALDQVQQALADAEALEEPQPAA